MIVDLNKLINLILRPRRNLIKRDRFVIEDNPNQLSGFPYKTYFVTNYLSDKGELQKHERILEEQLIKDFEMMGNEVELVEDSSRRAQHHQIQSPKLMASNPMPSANNNNRHKELRQQSQPVQASSYNEQQRKDNNNTTTTIKKRPLVVMDVEGKFQLIKFACLLPCRLPVPRPHHSNAHCCTCTLNLVRRLVVVRRRRLNRSRLSVCSPAALPKDRICIMPISAISLYKLHSIAD